VGKVTICPTCQFTNLVEENDMYQYLLSLMVVALLLLAPMAKAQTCSGSVTATTPTVDFTVHGDGTVTRNSTGLIWQQCSEGQTWSAGGCFHEGWASIEVADSYGEVVIAPGEGFWVNAKQPVTLP